MQKKHHKNTNQSLCLQSCVKQKNPKKTQTKITRTNKKKPQIPKQKTPTKKKSLKAHIYQLGSITIESAITTHKATLRKGAHT